jgi:hypothetical protein
MCRLGWQTVSRDGGHTSCSLVIDVFVYLLHASGLFNYKYLLFITCSLIVCFYLFMYLSVHV